MFRQGKPRAFIHNLRLASMLSFVAGIVNISGVLSIHTLTTNVTGHFAFFSEEFVNGNYLTAVNILSYIVAFFIGAFLCGFLIEWALERKPHLSHTAPMLLEVAMLVFITVAAQKQLLSAEWNARLLLFSMGIQNALVTKVSKATVRTTHLTGLFTDLGIEISQLFFHRKKTELHTLSRSIYLRLTIILFFFFGGVLGGFLYYEIKLNTLLTAAAVLLIALFYDKVRFGFVYLFRNVKRISNITFK
jgi:uncharacterized membrane protein YoaK (UPF0700 family)